MGFLGVFLHVTKSKYGVATLLVWYCVVMEMKEMYVQLYIPLVVLYGIALHCVVSYCVVMEAMV